MIRGSMLSPSVANTGRSTPLYSILLPTRNRADVLPFAIESVLNQTVRDFELLVVGDGCTDSTAEVIRRFDDDRLRWYDLPKAPHHGYANRNEVLRDARGELVAFMAHDDLWLPDHLEQLAACFVDDRIELAYSLPLWVTPQGLIAPTPFNLHDPEVLDGFLGMRHNAIPAACFVHRRRCLAKCGYWNDDLPSRGDMELWGRIIAEGRCRNFVYHRVPTCLHFRAGRRNEEKAGPPELNQWLRDRELLGQGAKMLQVDVRGCATEQQAVWRKIRESESQWTTQLRSAVFDALDRRYRIMDQRLTFVSTRFRRVEPGQRRRRQALAKPDGLASPLHDGVVFGKGFYDDEGQFRWLGAEGCLHFTFRKRPKEIRVDCACGRAEYYSVFPFRVDIGVDGVRGKPLWFRKSNQKHRIAFRPKGAEATLQLRSETTFVPREMALNSDCRALSIRVTNVAVVADQADRDHANEGRVPKSGRSGGANDGAAAGLPTHNKQQAKKRWRCDFFHGFTRVMRRLTAAGRAVERLEPVPEEPQSAATSLDPKIHWARFARQSFSAFLASDGRVRFPECRRPQVSILLVLYNRCELTHLCLQSILANCRTHCEVILVDNASRDETPRLLGRLDNVTIVRNPENVGFIKAANQAARMARADHLLFLNNDTQLVTDGPAIGGEVLRNESDVGAVGGRLVLPDGTLQTVGGAVCSDGSILRYGHGSSPVAPAFTYQRNVDFCSGAFLMTRKSDFERLGGFDESYFPAYYEDVDYCVRLAKQGKRVIYDPRVLLLHYGTASGSKEQASELSRRNRLIFCEKHRDWLQQQRPPFSLLDPKQHQRIRHPEITREPQ